MTKLIQLAILIISFCVAVAVPLTTHAITSTSSSFILQDSTIGPSGGSATSTSFQLNSTSPDAAGRSSSSSFGLVAGSLSFDTTPPINGTVSDGAGADIDQQTSMTTLISNWSGFSDPESGLMKYEYTVVRTVDNMCWNATTNGWVVCNYWNNNALGTTITLNNAALALQTGTLYLTCVRATNNANLLATAVCSNGVSISPSLTLSLGTTAIALPALNTADSFNGSSTSVVGVVTNAFNGYSLYIDKNQTMSNASASTIGDLADSGCSGAAVSWPGATNFGFSSSATVDSNKFNSAGTKYCGIPTRIATSNGLKAADHTTPITGTAISDSFTMSFRVQVGASQPAGKYQTNILYSVLPMY